MTGPVPTAAALLLALAALLAPAGASAQDAQALRADLAQFRRDFFALDRAYPAEARRVAQRRLDALQARLDGLDATAFGLELAAIAALADNGHTLSFPIPRSARANRVEIRLAPFGTDFHVLRARTADADLLGARLLAIDGVPLDRLRAAARRLAGGPAAWRDRQAPFLFESPEQLHALGLARHLERARYRFALPDGRRVERELAATPPGPQRVQTETAELLLPGKLPERAPDGSDSGWRGLLPAERAPWSLQEPERPLRWRVLPELAALQIEMRRTFDTPEARLPDFFDAVRAAIREHRPEHLVLDLRLNGGGDLTQARDFAESLPDLVPGRVFVLTSPWTFSAAISLTGYLKQAAPARVLIVGEPVGDRLEFFAEGRLITLTHSGAVLLYATERHDYRHGCRASTDCHAPVVARPIALPSLAPDLPAPWTLQAYARGEDPALAAVAAALRPSKAGARP